MRSLTRGGPHLVRAAGHPSLVDVLDAIAAAEGITPVARSTVVRDRATKTNPYEPARPRPDRTVTRNRRS